MYIKHVAALLIAVALLSADTLTAQTTAAPTSTTTTTTTAVKATGPAALSWRKNKKTAKKLIKKGKIEAAIPYLEAGAQKKAKKVYFAQNLSKIELTLRDYKSSNKWYKVLVDKDSAKHKKPEYLFQYALTQKYMGQYETAINNFTTFKKQAGESEEAVELKKRATREILGAQKGIFYRDSVDKRDFKVKHLDATINQSSGNFAPVVKDQALYFNSMKGENAVIFKSLKNGKNFSTAESLSTDINVANANVTGTAFSADGNTMYYTVCPNDSGAKVKRKCEIYLSTLQNGVWTKGKSTGPLLNDLLFNNTMPAVGKNKDGEDVLYFVSDRNIGKGLDIFYSKINGDGSLGKPRSVGSAINSKGDETSPYFDVKSKTLYFSSNGLISIGGLDVFKTTWDANGDWTEPENLGTPVNSSADDYYFSINDKSTLGYEASNRVGGTGTKCETCSDDIYMVETTKLFLAVTGNVYEEKDSQRVLSQGAVSLYDDRNGTDLGAYNLINGAYFFDLEPKRGYKVLSRRDGYYDAVATFNTDNNTESDTAKYDLFLKKKVDENPLIGRVIGRIYYDYDQSKLRADSRDSLRKIMDIMNQFPNTVIEVGAHTDGKGTEDYNLALSKKRADAVMNYYIYEKKVNKARLIAKAYGTSQPVASNKTPDGKDDPKGRAMNRRTEFKIIDELKGGVQKTQDGLTAPAKDSKKPAGKKTDAAPKIKNDATPAKVVKKDLTTGKKVATTTAPAATTTSTVAAPAKTTPKSDTYKTAPATSLVVKGKVYTEKGGKRLLATDGTVFISSDEQGFEQKVFYVKTDGTYSFDLSRSTANTFKLIARKGTGESNEAVFNLDDLKASNKPIDLVIKSK